MLNNVKEIANFIPKIKEYDENLEKQNLWWSVVAMVGKVNNHGMEPQLLDSISETQAQFSGLKETLIKSLVKRYIDKVSVEMAIKSQAFIEILNRNLFERTADVGFLAMDDEVVGFLVAKDFSAERQAYMRQVFTEYVQKYSVYNNVVLLTPELEIAVQLTGSNHVGSIGMTAPIKEALESADYIECDQPIANLTVDKQPLTFLNRVVFEGKVVGILCLCFKFEDEFTRIYKTLSSVDSMFVFTLEGLNGQAMFSSHPNKVANVSKIKLDNNKLQQFPLENQCFFGYSSLAKGYQGYKGLTWASTLISPASKCLKHKKIDSNISLNENSALFPYDLNELNLEINTALLIVILNGKIISLKNKVKAFLPVLDSFQEIGKEIEKIFTSSIEHIHQITYQTMETEVALSARLAIDIMDRNLYERANDCRWWALNKKIRTSLSKPIITPEESHELAELLKSINNLYTVYTNIFIYNSNGEIVAMSNSDTHLLGKSIADYPEVASSLLNSDSQKYAVSDFESSILYANNLANRRTYTYHASILEIEKQATVGGIGVVFDSPPEFKEILDDFLPKKPDGKIYQDSFAVFVDREKSIISVTDNKFGLEVGKVFELNSTLFLAENGKSGTENIALQGIDFLVGYQVSNGYREYKVSDGYENDVICIVFVPS